MLLSLLNELRDIQSIFFEDFGVNDIYSNSKIYEFIIANRFNHDLIPGHSGSRDAKDEQGNEIEYKHFKESSSNHTWTFNDFSETTIEKLKSTAFVYFVYVDDVNYDFPGQVKWVYIASGNVISNYLEMATQSIQNSRKMINVSENALRRLGVSKLILEDFDVNDGRYGNLLSSIIETVNEIEDLTQTSGLLTSNKLWELLVAIELDHNINSEQGGRAGSHDAFDKYGNLYEYKVSKNHSWSFQDISENVLLKYLDDKSIILAVVDKLNMIVTHIYEASPLLVVQLLEEKLNDKRRIVLSRNQVLRRLQVSLSRGDLRRIDAQLVYRSQ